MIQLIKQVYWNHTGKKELHDLMIMMLTNKLTATPENWKKAKELAEREVTIYAKR